MRFYIDTPSIKIHRLSENDDFQIDFDINKDGFVAKLKIRLDPNSVYWDTFGEEDEQSPISFDKLIISLSTDLDVSNNEFLENAYFAVTEYLTILFRYIQIELGQYWADIGQIQDWSLYTFIEKTNAKWVIGDAEKEVGFPIGGFSKEKRNILFASRQRQYPDWSDGLDGKQTLSLKAWIEEHKPVDLERQLLAESKRLLSRGDYKSSSVLAITVLERPLEEFIKKRCKSKGISKKTLDTYDKNHFVGDYLKLLLPLVLEPNELTEWVDNWLKSAKHWFAGKFSGNQIIEWAVEFNKARNDAVHRGITPAFETVDKGIFAIEAIYEFVIDAIK